MTEKNIINKKNKLLAGFTLIELLVAIAIISILAGLTIIGLSSAKQKANQARAFQSFKQISLAMQLYYDKNNEWPNPFALPGIVTHSCSTSCIADFADDSDPNNKFYPAWDASWYCEACTYSFRLHDFDCFLTECDGKPDIGVISINGGSAIYSFIPCITNKTQLNGNEFCGRHVP